jgi:pimeloyl-ACP methyl ester carboxylesterase
MNFVLAILLFAISIFFALAGITRAGAWIIESRYQPAGGFAEVNGTKMHFVHVPPGPHADLPPIVFIHGASGNLRDPMDALRGYFEGRAEMLFVDRPGHGWSGRGGPENSRPDGQAATIAALMDHLGIKKGVIFGHSFGGAVAAAFAVTKPEKTAGLVFASAVSHPWPGGDTSWYYELSVKPIIGWLFTETLSLPAGWLRMQSAIACVFSPNKVPEGYLKNTAIPLVLRPSAFRNNASDVAGLYDFVSGFSKYYKEISAPTVIISGTHDTVVYEEIHSAGLARDIPGADIVWVRNLGHKSDYVTPELIVAAVEKVSGEDASLQNMAIAAERRIAGDRFGPVERCLDEKIASITVE